MRVLKIMVMNSCVGTKSVLLKFFYSLENISKSLSIFPESIVHEPEILQVEDSDEISVHH